VALCDVIGTYAAHTIKKYPKAKLYHDYREMLDKQKDIDGSWCHARPHPRDHLNGADPRRQARLLPEAAHAHVYEARMLARPQGGESGHADGHPGPFDGSLRLTCDVGLAGVIGEVREVEACADLSYYPGPCRLELPVVGPAKDTPPAPAGLHWDLWIGPAAMRPYHRAYHPATWRCFWDFGWG